MMREWSDRLPHGVRESRVAGWLALITAAVIGGLLVLSALQMAGVAV